jgi:hypothetical protein
VQMTGEVSGTLTVDAQGRLQRLELPGSGIVVSATAPPAKK